MTAKYGVGIIGAGWVSGEYVKAFRDHPLTEVVGMYNKTPEKATRLMEFLDVDGKEFETLDDLFNDDRINIVVSCTHPHVRAEHAIRAAETGRHCVLEKPVGMTLEETMSIRDAIAKAGVKSICSFVLRWNPQYNTIRQMTDDGTLGEFIYGEADYWHPIIKAYPGYPYYIQKKYAGSAFLVAGGHAVDGLRYLSRHDIVEVAAYSSPPRINMDYDYDPIAVAVVKFDNGAVGKLSSIIDADTRYVFNMQIFGTEATFRNNQVYSSKHFPGNTDYYEFPTVKPDSGDVAHHPFVPEIAHFMECIENDVESHASIYDALKSQNVCYAVDESIAKGGQPAKVVLG